MTESKKARSPRKILIFVVAMLLLSGSLRLGSVGIAIASSPEDTEPSTEDGATLECVTDAETQELMALLRERSDRVAEVEATQAQRQKDLVQAEAELLENLNKLEDAETRLSATIQRVDGASSDDVSRLTSVYESMKPKDAALLFEQMNTVLFYTNNSLFI